MINYNQVTKAAGQIEEKFQGDLEVGVVLGSGLSDAISNMQIVREIPFEEIDGMPISTNKDHPGKFILGELEGKKTICMQGRIHLYEGYTPEQVAFPIFMMHLMGVKTLILTNAAGAINADYKVEDFILIKDHINFTGQNPLFYSMDERLGKAFCDMSFLYSPKLIEKVVSASKDSGVDLKTGVYIGVKGPSFETPAEIRAFRAWGADLVGMSTVCEAIAASSCGMEVLGVSLVTNMAAGMVQEKISSDDIMRLSEDIPQRLGMILHAALA